MTDRMHDPVPETVREALAQWDANHPVLHDLVPETVREALAQWDANHPVFTVEMGGIGPGYEQCIHILVFELLRDCLLGAIAVPRMGEPLRDWGDSTVDRLDEGLGFSGAQVGAAKRLAAAMLIKGYRATVQSVETKRHIQVSKGFPIGP
jgi:hypothetical protein